MPDTDEEAAILREATMGKPVREIAKARGMTVPEVNHVLDLEAERLFGAAGLRRAMLLETERLGLLKQSLWTRAMTDGDLQAAAVYVKASERLASMVGMNHPLGHLVTISGSLEPIEHETSTQQLRRVFDELLKEHPAKLPAANEQPPGD
jgi:hypothetical protein